MTQTNIDIVQTYKELVDSAIPDFITKLQHAELGTVALFKSVMPERRVDVTHVEVTAVPPESWFLELEQALRPHMRTDSKPFPPRLNGLIQVMGPNAELVKTAALRINALKSSFGDGLKTHFPKMHQRERFLRQNFESLCARSVHRQLLIRGDDVLKTTFHWSECNPRTQKIELSDVGNILGYSCDEDTVSKLLQIVESRMSTDPHYKLIHVTSVRVHPVQYIKYRQGDGYRREPQRSGLPLVVFGSQPLPTCQLEPYQFGADKKRQNNHQRFEYFPILPEFGIFQRQLTPLEIDQLGSESC